MPRTRILAVAVALAALAITGTPAASAIVEAPHLGNPNYESIVKSVTPHLPGLTVEMLNGDDRLGVVNETHRTIIFKGYQDEPFLRMAADGVVSVNLRSPAYYLDQVRSGLEGVDVPTFATGKGAPEWKVISKNSRYEFHDHRTHWMATTTPKQVTDKSKRTKIFDWKVPFTTGGKPGAIAGTLYWRGSSGGPPVGAIIGIAVLLLGSLAVLVVVRRRRSAAPGDSGPPPEHEEAW